MKMKPQFVAIVLFSLTSISDADDKIDHKQETCDHLLYEIEESASHVTEAKSIEKATHEYNQTWHRPLEILTYYTQIYNALECDKTALPKALYRLVEFRKLGEKSILEKQR